MAGRFLFCSPSERSKLDFKCNASELSIFPSICGCTGARCSPEGIIEVCFEEAEKGFPQTNYRQVLN